VLTTYHAQAGIAACHALAPSYAATNWPMILSYYDLLVTLDRSPVVLLNRAIALAGVYGPAAGLAALTDLDAQLPTYPLLYATRGALLARAGDRAAALAALHTALALTTNAADRRLIERRLLTLTGGAAPNTR
jgi:RNA polymerase sigma-70 factor, ECF subfamily